MLSDPSKLSIVAILSIVCARRLAGGDVFPASPGLRGSNRVDGDPTQAALELHVPQAQNGASFIMHKKFRGVRGSLQGGVCVGGFC